MPWTRDQIVAGETPEIACQKKEGKRRYGGSGLEHNCEQKKKRPDEAEIVPNRRVVT